MTTTKLIFEGPDTLVYWKESGIPTVPLRSTIDGRTLLSIAAAYNPEVRCCHGANEWEGGVIHRLDTLTKGLVLIARNQKAYNATGGNFVYNGQTIALTKYDRFYKVDTLASVPMGNHLKFDPAYVDTLLATDLQPVALEEPTLLRSDGYDCMYIHQAIAAKGKCVYQAKGSGAKELFVVAENGGTINLVVKNPKNKVEVKDASSAGKPSAEVTWSMPRFSDYSIEVENTSDKDISVIIVTN